ncbi:MAG: hypothetical protein IT165_07750 [Bryobacterales bacterium]|nr:hypothetical protein [Bryobacterales bacterium]
MAGSADPIQTKGAGLTAGPPNMHRRTVRQATRKSTEERWREMVWPKVEIEPVDYEPRIVWANTTRLHFEATGFNFTGDPATKARNGLKVQGEGRVVNVAALVAEEEDDQAAGGEFVFGPIQWDEIEEGRTEPVDKAADVLEVYEPPESPAQELSSGVRLLPAPEVEWRAVEPDWVPKERAGVLPYGKPALRIPPLMKPALTAEPMVPSGSRIHIPALSLEPLRPVMIAGRAPVEDAPVELTVEAGAAESTPAEAKEEAEAPGVEAATDTALVVKTAEVAAPAESAQATQATNAPEAVAAPEAVVAPEAVAEDTKQAEVASVAPEPAPVAAPARETGHSIPRRKGKRQHRPGTARLEPVEDPIEEPAELGEDIQAELAAANVVEDLPAAPALPEKSAAVDIKQTEPPPAPVPEPRFSFGGLAEEPKPKAGRKESMGLRLAEPVEPARELITPVTGMGLGAKLGIALAIVAVAGVVAYFSMGDSPKPAGKSQAAASTVETAGVVTGEPGWSTDWANDERGRRWRQISFYRPSMQISDYRVEFQAEIEYKAVSWVVRAPDTKTYWVLKVAQLRGGPSPDIRFTRTLVKDGKVVESEEKKLPFPTVMGMVYRVRTDVAGSRFAVTIQDKPVDEWRNAQALTGGFGVANEGAERGQIRSIQMWHLREKTAQR